MAISSLQVTVGTTPTLIYAADAGAETVHLHCETALAWIGGSDVTTTTGYKMDINDKLTIALHETGLYAVSAAGVATMSALIISK